MKKLLVVATALFLIAAPASAQTTREVRPFTEFLSEALPRLSELEAYAATEAYEPATLGLQDFTIWMLEKDPEPCYAGLWGVVIAFTTASAQSTLIQLHASENQELVAANLAFLARIKAVQDVITFGPTLDC